MAGSQIMAVQAMNFKQGDVIKWLYTCDLGADVGSEMH